MVLLDCINLPPLGTQNQGVDMSRGLMSGVSARFTGAIVKRHSYPGLLNHIRRRSLNGKDKKIKVTQGAGLEPALLFKSGKKASGRRVSSKRLFLVNCIHLIILV